ncbi:hydrophobin family protein [Aspergillus lucknowensis]|uniref:Spore-wall fungal hydrophobin dewA n=1 Tax=Aspergillus lucknowensis TaxID=176173 RepID=A0ABR4LFF2_9EURO
MHFTLPTILLAAATAVNALPEAAQKMNKLATSSAFRAQAESAKCDVGAISCCNAATETKNDGLLTGLLGGGLIRSLSGVDGSACAKASLIDELGLLSLIDHTETGPVCKNIVACCPEGTKTVCLCRPSFKSTS